MRLYLKKISIVICSNLIGYFCFGQKIEESGVDTVRSISWDTELSSTDYDGNLYYYERFEYAINTPNRVVVIAEGNNKPSEISYFHIPDSCECISGSIQVADSSNNRAISKTGEVTRLDSVFKPNVSYSDCLEQYFLNNNKTLDTDTIWVSKIKLVPYDTETAFSLLNQGWWIKDKRHGYEISYYSTKELKRVLIKANYRIKYIGQWERGKKHGKWKYYDTSGKLISTKKYKHGILMKEKSF